MPALHAVGKEFVQYLIASVAIALFSGFVSGKGTFVFIMDWRIWIIIVLSCLVLALLKTGPKTQTG